MSLDCFRARLKLQIESCSEFIRQTLSDNKHLQLTPNIFVVSASLFLCDIQ